MFVSADEPTATSGTCVCGAIYAMAVSGEFVTYSGEPVHYRNADTVSDGAGTLWACPFCGQMETRGDVSGLVQP